MAAIDSNLASLSCGDVIILSFSAEDIIKEASRPFVLVSADFTALVKPVR